MAIELKALMAEKGREQPVLDPLAYFSPEQQERWKGILGSPAMSEAIKPELERTYRDTLAALDLGQESIDERARIFEGPLTANAVGAVLVARRAAILVRLGKASKS